MKKCAKVILSCLLMVCMMSISGGLTSCNSTKTMNKSKKYNSGKVIKSNYRVRGNNKDNGATYRSY